MKPHLDIKHHGTLSSEDRIRMDFDPGSIAHLMSVLTDLYSDQEMAVIREYSTNGADSHSAAGISKPIEVTTPTELLPLFIVKDYGVGMSAREVYENFSKYGWSSKRDTDDETGMLGLGCKSALTYTSQFTMVCVKDGIENIVLVTRETDGAGAVQIVETTETDQPDGVEVRVPVKNASSFARKIQWFFRFWERGTVLVDDHEPTPFEENAALVIDPDIFLTESLENDYVVMGGVPYPLPDNQRFIPRGRYGTPSSSTATSFTTTNIPTGTFHITATTGNGTGSNYNYQMTTTGTTLHWKHSGQYHVVVKVPMGTINFTPSREQLALTKRTVETVATAREFIYERFHRIAQDEVNQAGDWLEAIDKASNWTQVWNTGEYKYRGYAVPIGGFWPKSSPVWEWDISYKDCSKRTGQIDAAKAYKCLHVYNHSAGQVHAATKKRVETYMAQNGLEFRTVLFYEHLFGSPWLDAVTKVDYADIRAIKNPINRKKPEGVRVMRSNGTTAIVDKILPRPGQTLWMSAGDYRPDRHEMFEFFQKILGHQPQIVLVTKEGQNAFLDEHPDIPNIRTFVTEYAEAFAAMLTPAEIIYINEPQFFEELGFHHLSKYCADKKVFDRIQDPDLRMILESVKDIRESTRRTRGDLGSWMPRFGLDAPKLKTPQADLDRVAMVKARYPMLVHTNHFTYRGYGTAQGSEIIEYLNGAYLLSQLRVAI